jgi:hypothetical protein
MSEPLDEAPVISPQPLPSMDSQIQAASRRLVDLAEPELVADVAKLGNPFVTVGFELVWPFLKPLLTNVLVRIAGKVLPKPSVAA